MHFHYWVNLIISLFYKWGLSAACVVEAQQNTGVISKMLLCCCYFQQFTTGTLFFSGKTFTIYHPAVYIFKFINRHTTTTKLLNTTQPYPKSCPPSCIITHSANPPPPSKWWWWGTKQEVKRDLKAPATHRLTPPPHQTSPLMLSQAAPWLCVLAPVQVFDTVTGRVTLCVWPRACMLDVVIINAPFPPGRRSPKQEELACSGEALDLENSCAG